MMNWPLAWRRLQSGVDLTEQQRQRIAQLRAQRFIERLEQKWDESKHPRGQPGNASWEAAKARSLYLLRYDENQPLGSMFLKPHEKD